MRLFGANEQYANGGSSEMRVSEGSILMFWKDEGFTSHGAAAFSFSGSELLALAQSSEDVSMASILDNSPHFYSNSQSFLGNTSTLFILHQPVRPGST